MLKRTVLFGAMAATVVASIVAILAALDVITLAELRATLGRSVLVVGIATTALLLLVTLGKAALSVHREAPPKP